MRNCRGAVSPGETPILIFLPPTVEVLGIVVDPGGAPVADARVQLAQLHPVVLRMGGAHFRRDSLVLLPVFGKAMVSELPEWISRLDARWPVPTTTTDEAGRFHLPAAPEGSASLVVDREGFEPLVLPEAAFEGGTRRVLGQLTLSRGRVFTGRVVDSSGTPVPGAEVCGGSNPAPRETFALLQPGGTADEEGRFELRGVPSVGDPVVAARRRAGDRWTVGRAGEDGVLEVALPGEGSARIVVKGSEGELHVEEGRWPQRAEIELF